MSLFPIIIEVEESQLGAVLRTLNGMPGIAKFHLDLDGAPKKGKNNKPSGGALQAIGARRDPKAPRAKDIIVNFLFDNGPQHLRAIAEHLEANGFTKSAASSVLNTARSGGITESDGSGIHRLTETAATRLRQMRTPALPAPGENSKPARRRSTLQIIIEALQAEPTGRMTRIALRDLLPSFGLAAVGVDGALNKLKVDGLIRTVSPGVHELTAKGKAKKYPPKE